MSQITKYLLSTIGLLSSIVLLAQPPAPPATPIDGGLGILLAGGALYGMKKLSKRRK